MKTSSKITVLLLTFLLLAISGCASINKAPIALDQSAKQFKPNPETSQVYVYRNEMYGGAISMPVSVDGKFAGTTGPKSYFKFDLPAGKHTIGSQGEKFLDIETLLGKLYFVWQEVKMGVWTASSKLQLVNDDIGMKGVLESKLIKSNF